MRVALVFLTALVLVTATPTAAQDWKAGSEVRIGTEGAYKPWNFRQRDGKLAGFEIDLVVFGLLLHPAIETALQSGRQHRKFLY